MPGKKYSDYAGAELYFELVRSALGDRNGCLSGRYGDATVTIGTTLR